MAQTESGVPDARRVRVGVPRVGGNMVTRRELLTVIAVLAASAAVAGAPRQSKPKEPKLTTVTLVVSGMT
jgi:hypothetical protein